jgi:peptidyl-prolyl cis-trans isomerase D
MALISDLRNKLGKVVVGFIAFAILSFVLADLLGNNSLLRGDNSVGEIGGRKISLEEFQRAVQERENNYILNFNRQPTERELPTIRQQAWDLLIAKYAIQKEFEKVGVEVTSDEVWDMVQGRNVDEGIRQAFVNPETGRFDRDMVNDYLQNMRSYPVEEQMRWDLYKQNLVPGRKRLKYENLLLNASYVTMAEAEREYHLQNDVAELKYLYVPFYAISDSLVEPSDSQLRAYYNKNKERYKTEESRDFSYIVYPVIPTSADTLSIKDELLDIIKELKIVEDDSIYAINNSDGVDAFVSYNKSSLPDYLAVFNPEKGEVYGPIIEDGVFKVIKVSDITNDTTFYARASHILIRADDESAASKSVARNKAQDVLNQIKAGADFATMAAEHGTDGTASRGGDLGWFNSGMMVKPFEDAVFNAKQAGLINTLVETDFGFHIIDVTNVKENTVYKIAIVEREIIASDDTRNEIFRQADTFSSQANGIKGFNEAADKEGILVRDAKGIAAADRRVTGLGDARQIIQWLYRDASVGEVSEVFDLDDEYIIAVMTGKISEGYKSLEEVKQEILPIVRNEIKGEKIINKLNALSGTLEEVASAFGADATVLRNSDLKLSSNSMTSIGFDPAAVGSAFSLEAGQKSKALAFDNGVVIFEMLNKTTAPSLGDYSIYKTQLEQAIRNKATFGIAEAIKDAAGIKDQRYKFY